MNNSKLLLLLPFVLLVASCSRDPKVQAQRYLENGNKFFEKAKYKEASIMYRRALQKDLRFGEAYYRLALTDLKLASYGDAVRSLRRAVELQPKNADAAVQLADIYLVAGAQDPAHAEQMFMEVREIAQKLIQADPNSFEAHRIGGQLALIDKDAAKAVREFTAATRLKKEQTQLSLALFQSLLLNNQAADADKLAHDVIASNKAFAPMYDALYVRYMGENRIADGEQILKLKVENNPKQPNYLMQLAGHYWANKKSDDLNAVVKRLSNEKDFPEGHLLAGDFFFFRVRDFESARLQYEAGVKAFPKDKNIYQKRLVELLATTGRNPDANQLLTSILKENPKDDDAVAMRAALMLQTGDLKQVTEAANDLTSLVAKTPQNHLLRYNLARAHLAKGDLEQARMQLEAAIKIRPDFYRRAGYPGAHLSGEGG